MKRPSHMGRRLLAVMLTLALIGGAGPAGAQDLPLSEDMKRLVSRMMAIHRYLTLYAQMLHLKVAMRELDSDTASRYLVAAGRYLFDSGGYSEADLSRLVAEHRRLAEAFFANTENEIRNAPRPGKSTTEQQRSSVATLLAHARQGYETAMAAGRDPILALQAAVMALSWSHGYQSVPPQFDVFAGIEANIENAFPAFETPRVTRPPGSSQSPATAQRSEPPTAQLDPSQAAEILDGSDIDGPMLRHFALREARVESCAQSCLADGDCRAYTYVKPGAYKPKDPPMCYLKSGVNRIWNNPRVISGIVRSRLPSAVPPVAQTPPTPGVQTPPALPTPPTPRPPAVRDTRGVGVWDAGPREARCGNYVLRTKKSLIAPGESFEVEFAGLPPDAYSITIADAGSPDTSFLGYRSPAGRTAGSENFPGQLPRGSELVRKYEIRLYVVPYTNKVDCRLEGLTEGKPYLTKEAKPITRQPPPPAVATRPGAPPPSAKVQPQERRTNLAKGKPATQTSTSQWSRANDAQGAVDGHITGSFGFHTNKEPSPGWMVDLQGLFPLSEIHIYNRRDMQGVAERARSITVSVSQDNRSWQLIYAHDGSVFGTDGKPLVVDLKGTRARFVMLRLREDTWFHLDEVEIYGTP